MRIVRKLVLPGMLIAAMGLAPAAASAQERHDGIGIGVKGGPVFGKFEVEDNDGLFENRTGWMAGVFIGGNRPGLVGVGVEINYLKRVSRNTATELDQTIESIDVPVYLHINGGSKSLSGVSFYGIVGPAFDINLTAEREGGFDIKDNIEDFDLNLVVGGGVEITRFIIEARYMKGLRSIAKDLGDIEVSQKSSAFAILFGVRFN